MPSKFNKTEIRTELRQTIRRCGVGQLVELLAEVVGSEAEKLEANHHNRHMHRALSKLEHNLMDAAAQYDNMSDGSEF